MTSKCVGRGQRESWFDFYDHIECVPTYKIFFLDVEIKFSSIVSQIFRQLYRRIRSYSQCYRIQKLWQWCRKTYPRNERWNRTESHLKRKRRSKREIEGRKTHLFRSDSGEKSFVIRYRIRCNGLLTEVKAKCVVEDPAISFPKTVLRFCCLSSENRRRWHDM